MLPVGLLANFGRRLLEEDLFISGIGGQGIQLVGKALALAAISEGLYVMLTGEYGGHMRGGSSVGSVVFGKSPLKSLPNLPSAAAVIALSDQFFENVGGRLRPASLVLAEETIADKLPQLENPKLVTVPAIALATEAGSRMAAGMAMAGAYAALTGVVTVDSVVAAMKELVPAYRRQHVETNERAIRAGAAAVPPLAYPVSFDEAGAEPVQGIVA